MHDLGRAVGVDGDDLLCSPIGEPEAALVPTRLLPENDARHEHNWCLHRSTPPNQRIQAQRTRIASISRVVVPDCPSAREVSSGSVSAGTVRAADSSSPMSGVLPICVKAEHQDSQGGSPNH